MADRGRKGKYETYVKPHFKKIEKWLNNGAAEHQVAEALGISYASFNNYKRDYPELRELCEKPRVGVVLDLRSALVNRALGMKVEKKKTYIRDDHNGTARYTEIIVDELPPDPTAIFGALNLYDPEYVKDKKAHELKEQELELRRQMAEAKDW